jgi:hypothetical protein
MNRIYFGIVEDRTDPLSLGRCRVRVIGLHTENTTSLPTRDLPWATPITPITSASISGIGQSPIGPVEGSCVALVFMDAEEQFPIMLGTIAGIPSNVNDFEIREDNSDLIFDPKNEETLPVQREAELGGDKTTTNEKYLGSLTKAQFDKLQTTIKKIESGGNYSSVNSLGFVGAYQFGLPALEDLGYIKKGSFSKYRRNGNKEETDGKGFNDPEVWTGKDGATSKKTFLSNKEAQDKAYVMYSQYHYQRLRSNGVIDSKTPPEKLAGLLGVGHNQGLGAVYKHLKGTVGVDGFGTTTTKYYDQCFNAIAGISTAESATYDNVKQGQIDKESIGFTDARKYDVHNSEVVNAQQVTLAGFTDPNGVYPRADYVNEPDTNRLARGHKIDTTIVGEKEATRRKAIHIATGTSTWSQPDVPYNAKYPYNHTYTSESGHVMEFDDTTNSERINIHHRAGTFLEIDSNGTQTNKIVGHGCTIIEKDGLVLIEGNAHVHVVGNITVYAGENAHIECLGDANIKAENVNVKANTNANVVATSVTLEATQAVNVKAPAITLNGTVSVGITAPIINLNGYVNTNVGAGTVVEPIAATVDTAIKFTGEHTELTVLNRAAEEAFTLEGTTEAASAAELGASMGSPVEMSAEDKTTNANKPPVQAGVCDFKMPITLDTQLTTNFKVKRFCISNGFPANGQHGLSPQTLACNLKQLAMNVVEPIFKEFAADRPHITSGLRTAKAGSKSQHERGEAVDIVFLTNHGSSNAAREFHYEMAKKIKNLVNFDQMILEYRTNSVVWIHISFKVSGNRNHVFTMNNDKTYGQGLILLKQSQ